MDERFFAYDFIGKVSLSELEYIVMHFVVTCDGEVSVTESKSVTYVEGLITSVALFLVVRRGYIITHTKKIMIFCCC